MTLRSGAPSDIFTIRNGQPWSEGVFYQNLPLDMQAQFPMCGTNDVNTGDTNTLVLPKPMISYLIRKKSWSEDVPLHEWTLIQSGNYLGGLSKSPIVVNVYKRMFTKGTHTIDNNSAMYLFVDPGNKLKFHTYYLEFF